MKPVSTSASALPGRRKLVKVGDLAELMASHHAIEGTRLHVLELLLFGFAYSSRFILLRTPSTLDKLADETVRKEIVERPSRFGRKLRFGRTLELERGGTIYYTGPVAQKDLLQNP